MTSVSFDPVAHLYDATRGYPEEVTRQIVQAMDQAANGSPQTRFLEVGIGTGRFALPLASLGRHYTGIDISEQMLSRLEEKLSTMGWQEKSQLWGDLPDEIVARKLQARRFVQEEKQGAMRIVAADMTDIPFHDASFDIVIAVHVFHLVSDWQKALQEVLRVLHPGGILLRCGNENWHEQWKTGQGDIRREWNKIVQQLGGSTERPGASEETVTAWLQQQGFETEQWEVLRWERTMTPRIIFEGVAQRFWSNTWFMPDDLFATALERLRQWVDERYGANIDEPYIQEERLVMSRTHL